MKFFKINNNIDPLVIGKFPQVYEGFMDFNIYNPNSSYYLNHSKSNTDTLWPVGQLAKKAKKTDLLSCSYSVLSSKLIISQFLYEILYTSNTIGIQFIKTKIVIKEKEEDFWIVHAFFEEYSFLDFDKCEFGFTDPMVRTAFSSVSIDSYSSFMDAYVKNQKDAISNPYPNHKPFGINKLSFNENSNVEFCSVISTINGGGIDFFVSENKKIEIENAGCSGIVFTDPNSKYPS